MSDLNNNPASIDVIIPIYNGADYIIDAIKSVATQTLKPNSIIVVNDGSTDTTEEKIIGYKNSFPSIPIQYLKKDNGGLSSARNFGIKASTAPYVAFLDADDRWFPTKLEKQMGVFQNSIYPKLGVVYCQYRIIDSSGDIKLDKPIDLLETMRGNIFTQLLTSNRINSSGSGVLVRRECFDAVGLFDLSLSALEDWDMWLRIAQADFYFDYSPDTLVEIRSHAQNMQKHIPHMVSNEVKFYNKWTQVLLDKKMSNLIPRSWILHIIKRTVNRLPRIDVLQLFMNNLSPQVAKSLLKTLI